MSRRLEFRLAVPADAYEIAIMSRYLIEVGLRGWTWPPERVTKAIRARDTNVLVGAAADNLVAFGIMEFGDATAHLSLLAVKPSHQRCGIGRQMMAWLEEAALVAGIARISLELRTNNFAARTFYRMLGYKEISYIPGYYRGVETAVRMSRDIRRVTPGRVSDPLRGSSA
jgi:ribosomal protein S18 acetylase RimI-like enzyme